MRYFRNALIATLALAVAVFATHEWGIEVLEEGIEVLADGGMIVPTQSIAPDGSIVEAVMVMPDGLEVLCDAQPVDPATGMTWVLFPEHFPGSYVCLRSPTGEVLAVDYVGGLEMD
jgi:hypothetical protein